MNKEEKEAIKWFDTERKLVEITNGDNNYFSIILNLIDKLQKQLDQLKEVDKQICNEELISEKCVREYYISKDRIRNKIKELDDSCSIEGDIGIVFLKELL